MRGARFFMGWCLFASATLAAAPGAQAQDDARLAKAHFNKATRFYEVGDYQQSLEEFKAAHMAKADPAFLFNIAQCHRQLGQPTLAVTLYKRYLAASPDAANRAEVEKRIADLEAELAAAKPSVLPPTPPPSVPAVASPSLSPVTPLTAPLATSAPAETSAASSGWRYLPWIGAGVTLALVGGAVATGLSASSKYNSLQDSCGKAPPGCSEGDINGVKSRALWANVLWGAAGVAAAGTGLAFVLTPKQSAVQVSWSF
jgi:tetratricopeptide (TPR) repeat protein